MKSTLTVIAAAAACLVLVSPLAARDDAPQELREFSEHVRKISTKSTNWPKPASTIRPARTNANSTSFCAKNRSWPNVFTTISASARSAKSPASSKTFVTRWRELKIPATKARRTRFGRKWSTWSGRFRHRHEAHEADHRIHHLHQAAEHLEAAGFEDEAHHVRQRAEELEHQLRAHHAGNLEREVNELREVVRDLQAEIRTLRQQLGERD